MIDDPTDMKAFADQLFAWLDPAIEEGVRWLSDLNNLLEALKAERSLPFQSRRIHVRAPGLMDTVAIAVSLGRIEEARAELAERLEYAQGRDESLPAVAKLLVEVYPELA